MLSRVKFGIADQWPHPSRIELPGVVRTLDYDPLQRPTHIQVQAIGPGPAETPTGPIHLDWRLAYDPAGNLIQRDTRDGPYSYAYDPLDRLIEVVPPASLPELPLEGYQYDEVGNRTQSAHQPGVWGYDPDHRLTQYGEGTTLTALTHTPNGQRAELITPTQRTRYHYDAADRLTFIERDAQEPARYQYDPFGRRIAKTINGFTTWYLYTDEGLIAELDTTGSLSRAYGWEPDSAYGTKPLWQAEIQGASWHFHFLHPDHLGTPQLATDAQGNISWQARSEAFGRTFPAPTNAITMNLRFPGQYFDQESGLHYNYYRDYDPEVGRYIEMDPVGLDGGLNTYLYANANPNGFMDPTGNAAIAGGTIIIGGTIIVGTCIATNCTKPIADAIGNTIDAIVEMCSSSRSGSCSCQHRDVFSSGGVSCQKLRELGICRGPYKGNGIDRSSCQANARSNAPAACQGCVAHCLFTPGR